MTACCRQNTILPLRSTVACPVRYIIAMDGVQKLGIDLLSHELPNLLTRLSYEIFDVKAAGMIFLAGGAVLPEIIEAICHCIARYFFHGSLPEVGRWMTLARLNARFDQGVARWLAPGALNEGPDALGAWSLWQAKNPGAYPARWNHSSWPRPAHLPPWPPVFDEWRDAAAQRPPIQPLPPSSYPPDRIDIHIGDSQAQWTPYEPGPPPPPPKPEAYLPRNAQYERPGFAPDIYGAARSYQPPETWHPHPHYPRHDPQPPAPEYTVRCNYCQEIYPQSAAGLHQCRTGRAYTISDSPSPTEPYRRPQRRSQSVRRGRSLSRGRDYHFPHRSSSLRRHWDPAYKPPRPGEYLHERRQVGPDHYLHFFIDEYGRERVVNKSDDVSVDELPW